jgi:hypothetical protein
MPRLHFPSGQRCEQAAGTAPHTHAGCLVRFVLTGVLPLVGDGSTPVRFRPASVFPPLAGFFFGGLHEAHSRIKHAQDAQRQTHTANA